MDSDLTSHINCFLLFPREYGNKRMVQHMNYFGQQIPTAAVRSLNPVIEAGLMTLNAFTERAELLNSCVPRTRISMVLEGPAVPCSL